MAVEVDARWEPMGAQEYYDYWRAMYNARGNRTPDYGGCWCTVYLEWFVLHVVMCSHLRCLAWMLLARCVLGKLQVHCLVKHVCPKVNIQKDNGVRMKIIGTHVDAIEIVYDEDS
ncbi:hypothetical protein ZEAMMB73_Zm00001d033570 [Zea mays]|uniref:Uncharacterized protein n=1 Tax=Zea mays TaxID=4577 RepID=A0A1D6L059_MAIZE|nr:hypothetical protein ZEAMMB73_Zm00001d033570 [Zea mays]